MDHFSQDAPGPPVGAPGPPIAGVPSNEAPPHTPASYPAPQYPPPQYPPPYGYEPYAAGPYEPPPSKGRGWLIALGIVVVFFVGIIALCAWAGSLISGTSPVVTGQAIALIHVNGVIAGTSASLSGASVTPESMLSQLKQAEDDNRVKAILLRVDSPGGTVAASEEIAAEIAQARKPVVVSIGDVGASGAYMVSSQADWIISGPGSDVGSIGVILEVADLQSLLNKLGVKFAVIHAGKFKDIGSPYRSLTPTETAMLQQQVDIAYEQFIAIVAKGRKMPVAKVRALATGMAWAGSQAKTYGLVDQLGTYNDAIDKAASLGKISGTPQIVEYRSTNYLNLINSLLGISDKLGTIGDALTSVSPDGTTGGRPVSR